MQGSRNPQVDRGEGKNVNPNEVQSLIFTDEDNLEADVEWAENNFDEFIPKGKDICKDIDAIRHTSRDNIADNMKVEISKVKK